MREVRDVPRSMEGGVRAKGSKHYRAKLNEADVRLIIELHPDVSTRQLARKFEVSQSAIARILTARNWKHV